MLPVSGAGSKGDPVVRDGLFDVIPFPIYVADADTLTIISVNKAMQVQTGAAPGEICHWAVYRQEKPCLFCKARPLAETDSPPSVIFEHFNDRDDRWYQLYQTLLTWFDGRTVLHSLAVDIGRIKDVQNELSEALALLALKNNDLERVSITDSLTGLFNRRRLDDVLEEEVERSLRYGSPLSVIILDIDHFKVINDTHGHQIGDQVLQAFAEILRSEVRSVDIVGRWGGEEFLVICPGTVLDGAFVIAEKLRQTIERTPFSKTIHTTSSFGAAELGAGETVRDLVSRTDSALYRAKSNGRNRVEV